MIKHHKNIFTGEAKRYLNNFIASIPKEDWLIHSYGHSRMKFPIANAGKYIWKTNPNRYELNNEMGMQIPQRIVDFALRIGIKAETMLINRYEPSINPLGLHQDKDEKSKAPILSISLGCSAIFETARFYSEKRTDFLLEDGDVFVFGGEDRMIWHGVKEVLRSTDFIHRYNLTIRQVNV